MLSDPLSSGATLILRALLIECGSVAVRVRGAEQLPRGRVDGVTIRGERWCSPGLLSARRLEFTVGAARLDAVKFLARRKIEFETPASGVARVRFDASDFERFLAHPLVGGARGARDRQLAFPSSSGASGSKGHRPLTTVDAAAGAVTFDADWRGVRVSAVLRPSATGFEIGGANERLLDGSSAQAALTAWLSELVVDLDGVAVGPVRSVAILAPGAPGALDTSGHAEPCMELELGLSVRRFPSLPPKF